jgi:multisubunit Na+/H+ antiporter MnhG subunit
MLHSLNVVAIIVYLLSLGIWNFLPFFDSGRILLFLLFEIHGPVCNHVVAKSDHIDDRLLLHNPLSNKKDEDESHDD